MADPKNTVIAGLVLAVVAPRVKAATGVDLTLNDVVLLIALFHGAVVSFERYFPPKVPKPPESKS